MQEYMAICHYKSNYPHSILFVRIDSNVYADLLKTIDEIGIDFKKYGSKSKIIIECLWNKIKYDDNPSDTKYCFTLTDFKFDSNIIDHKFYCKLTDIFNVPDGSDNLDIFIDKYVPNNKTNNLSEPNTEYIFTTVENTDMYISPNKLTDKILSKQYHSIIVNKCLTISENNPEIGQNRYSTNKR